MSGALDPVSLELQAAASVQLRLRATDGATVTPETLSLTPGAPAPVTVRLAKPGITSGRLEALDPAGKVVASVPWLVRPDEVEPIEVGPLRVSSNGRRVRFTLGSFKRGERTSIQVAERLILDLVDDRGPRPPQPHVPRRRARADARRVRVHAARARSRGLKFRVRAWAPRQAEPTTRTS